MVGAGIDMTTRKVFLIAVALSLAAHVVVLAMAGVLGGRNSRDEGEDPFTVTLERHPARTAEKTGSGEKIVRDQLEAVRKRARGALVDTVDLDRTDTKYYPYLLHVKEQIDQNWTYPDDAFNRGEVGTTVIQFAIAQEGFLADCRAVVSSGFASLDAESLRAVQSAAPFKPFSKEFGLARLNIVARFRYSLAE